MEFSHAAGVCGKCTEGNRSSKRGRADVDAGDGPLIADLDKQWEGRPLADKQVKNVSTSTRVCFQVGSHSNPWYILCNVLGKEFYDTLEDMLQARVKDLLPRAAYDLTAAIS